MPLIRAQSQSLQHSRSSVVSCENKHTSNRLYNSILDKVTVSTSVKHKVLDPSTEGKKVAAEETVISVASSLIGHGFELRLANSLARISKTLNIYPVMQLDNKSGQCVTPEIFQVFKPSLKLVLCLHMCQTISAKHYFMFVH